jgi:hypothetical protein
MIRRTLIVALSLCVTASVAQAQSKTLDAEQIIETQSEFTIDFGAFGGKTVAAVANTRFAIEIDERTGTARFQSYEQDIESLTLPGGLETGAITVSITDSIDAGFDRASGRFTTEDVYQIKFEGNLEAFGLSSPVDFPSTSVGHVVFDTRSTGRIILDWEGRGELSSPQGPPVPFDYTCHVETSFNVRQVALPNPRVCGQFDLLSGLALFAPLSVVCIRRRRR